MATVNDQGTAGQAEVSEAMAAAKIPRIASNVTNDDWGDPNAYPTRRLRHRRHLPAAPGAHRPGRQQDRPHPGRPGRRLGAEGPPRGHLQGRRHVPRRHPGARPAPPTSASSSWPPSRPVRTGVTLALGEQEAIQVVKAGQQLEHRPGHRVEPRDLLARRRRRAGRLRRADGRSSGPSRRRRPTSRCTRRSAPTSRHRATRRSSPRTSRPARCARGSGSTPCSR